MNDFNHDDNKIDGSILNIENSSLSYSNLWDHELPDYISESLYNISTNSLNDLSENIASDFDIGEVFFNDLDISALPEPVEIPNFFFENTIHTPGFLLPENIQENEESSSTVDFTDMSATKDVSHDTINNINKRWEIFLIKQVTPEFITCVQEENFEFGYISRSELIVRKYLDKNELATKNWINMMYNKYIDNDAISIGILRLLGRFDEQKLSPTGPTIAFAAAARDNIEIRELSIRIFESWGSPESLKALKQIRFTDDWLKEYADEVINDLEEKYANTSKKN